MLSLSLPVKFSESYFRAFLSVQHAVSLPPSEACRKVFPRFPLRPARCLAPSQRSSPQAISTVSVRPACCLAPSHGKLSASYLHGFRFVQHAVSLPSGKAPPKLFPQFPLRPACCLGPFQRSSLRKLFPRFSAPSSMLSRSLPAKLSASDFHGFLSVQHAVSLRPMLSRSLPAKLSASYFHGIPSVQHAVSLPPSKAFRMLFPRFPLCPACCIASPSEAFRKLFARFPLRPACCLASSHRSSSQAIAPFQRSFFASYFQRFLSVQHAVSPPPGEAFRTLFPCIAPSRRNFPQAISTVSSPSSILCCSLSISYFPRFPFRPACCLAPFQRTSLRKLFPRFPVRPACCLAPSQRSFPQAISTVSHPSSMLSTVSSPSSMLSRSLPAKLSACYLHLHGFLSV